MHRLVNLQFEKATKNTYRFKEVGDKADQIIGVLYVQKSAFDGEAPAELQLTITDGKSGNE